MLEKNSLAIKAPPLIPEFHPTKNDKLFPFDVAPKGKVKVWWLYQYGHEWQATTSNRYYGAGCPYCEGRKVSEEYNLETRFPFFLNNLMLRLWCHHTDKEHCLTTFNQKGHFYFGLTVSHLTID